MTIYKIKGQDKYAEGICWYTNGIFTSCGFYPFDQLEEVEHAPGITYSSECATELPFNYFALVVRDDRGKFQHIKEIKFQEVPAYYMEDGTTSKEVVV